MADTDRVGLSERVAAGAQALWPLVTVPGEPRDDQRSLSNPPSKETAERRDAVRWGVMGTGGIASAFVDDLRLPGADRRRGVARPEHRGPVRRALRRPRRHPTYEALVTDDEVDVVYVATPHPGHHAAALMAIEAGKAVLVEKPFTMDAAEAASLVTAARARGLFLMEAMWARFAAADGAAARAARRRDARRRTGA